MKSKIYKIIAISVGICLALIAGEITARVYYIQKYKIRNLDINQPSKLEYTHKPSVSFVNKHGIRITYNSMGFIGEEVPPKAEGVFRILGVGDSITAADYLPANERYLNRIKFLLSGKIAKNVEIINAGVSGYNTWQELALIRSKGLAVKPDLIIVGICVNDYYGTRCKFKKTCLGTVAETDYRRGVNVRYLNFLYQRSDLYKIVYDFLHNIKKGLIGAKSYSDEPKRDYSKWLGVFNDMICLADEHKIKILFVLFPREEQILKSDTTNEMLTRFFKEKNAYYLDLIKDFNAHAEEPLFRKKDSLHPLASGHKIAAKAIADYIIKHRLQK